MAGSQSDVAARLRALLPSNWFPQGALPVLDSVLAGPASVLSWVYGLLAYARNQTRIATATDGFLDIAASDFFGNNLLRGSGETDAAYSARIKANLFTPQVTRSAVIEALTNLTGRAPIVFEPQRPQDCGGIGTGYLAWGQAGNWASPVYPYQCFIQAYRPLGKGVASVQGWCGTGANGYAIAGYGVGAIEWVPFGVAESIVTDTDIYGLIAAIIPAGTIAWVAILD